MTNIFVTAPEAPGRPKKRACLILPLATDQLAPLARPPNVLA